VSGAGPNELDLLDWKRRIFTLYAEVRSSPDPGEAWQHWRRVRDELVATHPQSPVPPDRRAGFAGLDYFAYDSALRVLADVESAPEEARGIAGSAGSAIVFRRFARARFELAGEAQALELYWLEGYGGGIFLPFGDATSGRETYGGGRYLLDTVKGSDLGEGPSSRLILDFNFAYNPSCAYDPRWACPLTPSANRLPFAVRAGEKHAAV
jgi:uncharacterized protein (DUF1684 family)